MSLLPSRRRNPSELVPSRRRLAPVAAQLAQDAGLAALLGGNLFGRFAMHPALADVSDKAQRGRVLNGAWRRYGSVNSLAVPGGAVPMGSGSQPAAETPRRAAQLKRVVNLLGGLNLAAELSLVAVNALLQRGGPRGLSPR